MPSRTHSLTPAVALRLAFGVACAAAAPTPARAQQAASFDLAAYVPQPIALSVGRHLAFGKLLQGATKTIAYNSNTGQNGYWSLTGAACAEVDMGFVLPATLAGPSGATLPIDTWTADWDGGYGAPQVFTPALTPTRAQFTNVGASCATAAGSSLDDQAGTLTVRLGATLRPAADQRPGPYTATVTIQVSYVGL